MPIESHTQVKNITLPQQQIRTVNRRYVSELFRDLFTANNGDKADNLEAVVFKWASKRGSQFGGSCDLLGSTTGLDCNNDMGNANIYSHVDPNTIRESYIIKLCEELIGQEKGLSILLRKIDFKDSDISPFDQSKINQAYELFFRTKEVPEYYLETLSEFIHQLQQKNETTRNTWRGIFQIICESPEWQKL